MSADGVVRVPAFDVPAFDVGESDGNLSWGIAVAPDASFALLPQGNVVTRVDVGSGGARGCVQLGAVVCLSAGSFPSPGCGWLFDDVVVGTCNKHGDVQWNDTNPNRNDGSAVPPSTAVALSPDSKSAIVVSGGRLARIWLEGQPEGPFPVYSGSAGIVDVAIARDGRFAFALNSMGEVVRINLLDEEVLVPPERTRSRSDRLPPSARFQALRPGDVVLRGLNQPTALALAFDDLTALVSCSGDNTVRLLRVADGRVTAIFRGFDSPRGIAFTPDNLTALVANSGGNNLGVIKLETGVVSFPTEFADLPNVRSVGIAVDGCGAATTGSCVVVRLHDQATGRDRIVRLDVPAYVASTPPSSDANLRAENSALRQQVLNLSTGCQNLADRISELRLLRVVRLEHKLAEQQHMTAEQQRMAAEQQRMAAEQQRTAAEQLRTANEQLRTAKEQLRTANGLGFWLFFSFVVAVVVSLWSRSPAP
jgi:hypothetical protein